MKKIAAYIAVMMCVIADSAVADQETAAPLTQPQTIRVGVYITEGNRGSLEISRDGSDKSVKFVIDALGSNGHICNLDGSIQNGLGVVRDDPNIEGDECIVQFAAQPGKISVVVRPENEDACRFYCGARAWFSGNYFPVNPYCSKEADVRASFLKNYQEKKYIKAKEILVELLGQCERFMYWHSQAEVRNDLALTEFHLGDKESCLKSLEPIKNYALDKEVFFTPIDEDWGMEMVKKTKFNWKKCGGIIPTNSTSERKSK